MAVPTTAAGSRRLRGDSELRPHRGPPADVLSVDPRAVIGSGSNRVRADPFSRPGNETPIDDASARLEETHLVGTKCLEAQPAIPPAPVLVEFNANQLELQIRFLLEIERFEAATDRVDVVSGLRLAVRGEALRSFGNNQSTSRLAGLVVRRGLNAYFHRLNRRLLAIAVTLPVIFPPDFFRHC